MLAYPDPVVANRHKIVSSFALLVEAFYISGFRKRFEVTLDRPSGNRFRYAALDFWG